MQAPSPSGEDMARRVEQLERENDRLRQRLEKSDPLGSTENPCFNPVLFQKAIGRLSLLVNLPAHLGGALIMVMSFLPATRGLHIGPIAFFDMGGLNSGILPSLGVGIFASGAVSLGFVAYGGLSFGVIAIGGGAVGIVAMGGGAVGVYAVGGGAAGHYAAGARARGNHVLCLARQDPAAVSFFGKWIPGMRNAVTSPMPVILLPADRQSPNTT